jgi:4-hydroxybenzoate polyprenyltransferase
MNYLKRIYRYQDERFPVKILFFTTLAVVLSSAAVLSFSVSWQQIVLNLCAALAFLFHIRVIDESRDLQHDNRFHPERPVQRGLISIRELVMTDLPALAFFIAVALLYGKVAAIYGVILLIFSYIAWNDFFLGERFKRQFYLYNAVNMIQMVLLQLFIYAVFTHSFRVSKVMWIHLLFVIFNTIIMEFVRKIKTGEEETKGNDTYSWHLGYARSLYIFYLFSLVNFFTFAWMLYTISKDIRNYLIISLLLLGLLSYAVFSHLHKRKKTTENLLLLSTVVNYVGLNLLIYFYNF